jgi:hypothetical protein
VHFNSFLIVDLSRVSSVFMQYLHSSVSQLNLYRFHLSPITSTLVNSFPIQSALVNSLPIQSALVSASSIESALRPPRLSRLSAPARDKYNNLIICRLFVQTV